MEKQKLDWVNTIFIATVHVLAVAAVVYMTTVHFSWWTVGLGLTWLVFSGLSITGGYHRLFSHKTYRAAKPVRAFYLLFGAAAIQNSALKWSADHRVHHRFTDEDHDPYNITRGFWWAHIGWIFFKAPQKNDPVMVRDLAADPLIQFQYNHYVKLAVFIGFVVPAFLGLLWGDPVGALLVAGFLRLTVVWHATFSINSLAHMLGTQHYSVRDSSRDSFITAMVSMGEGYHNFHHRFQMDYRNGVRWYHFDPTKWVVFVLSKVGLTKDLKRASKEALEHAKESVRAELAAAAKA